MPGIHRVVHTNGGPTHDLEEIEDNEFPSYFVERRGRLWTSSTTTPYCLPCDTPEQERQRINHACLQKLLHSHCVPPIRGLLNSPSSHHRNVVDFCCGTGSWVVDMAAEFPHCQFSGIDIVPIQTRYPEDNVLFEMADIIREQTRYENASVDVVHARFCDMVTHNYAHLIREAARILMPGGIFFSGEFTNAVFFHPSSNADPNTHAPHLCRYFSTMTDALYRVCSIRQISGTTIPQLLESTGLFDNITVHTHAVPLGDWMDGEEMQEIGREMRRSVSKLMNSTEELIRATRLLTQNQIESMIEQAEGDLNNANGLVLQYCTIFARRRG